MIEWQKAYPTFFRADCQPALGISVPKLASCNPPFPQPAGAKRGDVVLFQIAGGTPGGCAPAYARQGGPGCGIIFYASQKPHEVGHCFSLDHAGAINAFHRPLPLHLEVAWQRAHGAVCVNKKSPQLSIQCTWADGSTLDYALYGGTVMGSGPGSGPFLYPSDQEKLGIGYVPTYPGTTGNPLIIEAPVGPVEILYAALPFKWKAAGYTWYADDELLKPGNVRVTMTGLEESGGNSSPTVTWKIGSGPVVESPAHGWKVTATGGHTARLELTK